jgi:putative ABC transport system permease protein
MGDMEEEYHDQVRHRGKIHARVWYVRQALCLVPAYCLNDLYWSVAMFKNALRIAIRSIRRNPLYFILNVTGLAVALSCLMLIFFHVRHELSYERGFPDSERIYRLTIHSKYGETYRHWAVGPVPLGPEMLETLPEVEEAGRLRRLGSVVISNTGQGAVRRFEETEGFFADPSVLSIFDLKLLSGDPAQFQKNPSSILLSSQMALKYFGHEDPVGKTINLENYQLPAQVAGVFEDLPTNTHLRFDFLFPFSLFVQYLKQGGNEGALESRTWKTVYTYALLSSQRSRAQLEPRLDEFFKGFLNMPERVERLHLQPIRRIHLHSRLEQEMGPNSDVVYVYVFSAVAFLLILIACINYVNISLAQAFKRMKEVGVRKVLGAQRVQLVRQFIGDSLLVAGLSFMLALLLVYLVFPLYTQMSGKVLPVSLLFGWPNILIFLGLTTVIGLLAGIYPALFMSGFQPANTIKSLRRPRSTANMLRKALVIFQFAVSVFLMIGTITIYRQIEYFRKKDLGFQRKGIIAVTLYGDLRRQVVDNSQAVKKELMQTASITHVALTSNLPGERFSVEHLRALSVDPEEDIPTVRFMRVDHDFLKTLGISVTEGRDFQPGAGERHQFIMTETAVQTLGFKNPLGIQANNYGREGDIVGIIPDFHFASLHHAIEPLVLDYNPRWGTYLLIRFHGDVPADIIPPVKEVLNKLLPDQLFQYTSMDDQLNGLYLDESRIGNLFRAFSVLAIFISCLGLFGLSVYAAEIRVKEVGIRKVMGASVPRIFLHLGWDFSLWILLANGVAWPAAYLAMNRWLQNFAFRVSLSWWTFLVAGFISMAVSLATTSYYSIRAASANPVDTLRYE